MVILKGLGQSTALKKCLSLIIYSGSKKIKIISLIQALSNIYLSP